MHGTRDGAIVAGGIALLRRPRTARWLGWWGAITGVLGLIGLWRNVTPLVAVVADIDNYLLPAWMIGFGFWLVAHGARRVG